jgi:hypothetical protein
MVVLAQKKAWSLAKKLPHRLAENGFCVHTRVKVGCGWLRLALAAVMILLA